MKIEVPLSEGMRDPGTPKTRLLKSGRSLPTVTTTAELTTHRPCEFQKVWSACKFFTSCIVLIVLILQNTN